MLAQLAFYLLPKDLFQGRPTERLLRASGWTYLIGVLVSLVLYSQHHSQYDYRVHLISATVFFCSYLSVRIGITNYTSIKLGALWSLLEFIYITVKTGGINSPALVWMSILGVVVILFFNRTTTKISITVLLLGFLVFFILGNAGWFSTEVLARREEVVWALTYKVSVVVMVTLGALATDWMYGHLLSEIETSNKNLEDTQAAILKAQSHKDEFLASIGHELRTPMNAILGFNDILRQELADNPDDVAVVDHIRKSTEQLLRLVNNILDYAQLQANRLSLVLVHFSLSQMMQELVARYQLQAQQKGIRLLLDDYAVQNLWALGDRQRITQVLSCLVDNALKFTNTGQITLRVLKADGGVYFEVQDTGIGIANDRQAQIFQRFEHANLETNRQFGGSGLGLALCDQLVRLMQGDIGVKSGIDQGATFWFKLPLALEPEKSSPKAVANPKNGNPKEMKFLLVDDNAVNLMVARLMLTKCFVDCHVKEVGSGQAALAALANESFDMVLMDVVMPDMDGPTATQAIRKLLVSPACHIPVLAMTANTHPVDRERYLAAGMNDVIHKPLDAEEMSRKINQAMMEHQRMGYL